MIKTGLRLRIRADSTIILTEHPARAALVESRFRILGRTRILVGDHFDDEWSVLKPRGILAVLLLHPRRSIPFDELRDWIWPDRDERPTTQTLYSYKKRMMAGLARMAEPPRIVADAGTYRIEIDRAEVDFFQFRDAADRARSLMRVGDHDAAIATIGPALELWNGIPLADAQGELARNWRQLVVTDHLVPAQDTLMRALSALSRHDEVLQRLADLPVEQQSNLTLIKRKLEALYGRGPTQDARAYLLATRKRLRDNGDDDEADDLLRFSQEFEGRNHIRPTVAPSAAAVTTPPPDLLPHDIKGFTGRAALLSQLDAMATTTTGDVGPGIVLLSGPPGVGKTALAIRWSHRMADRFPGGRLYADLGGFSGGRKLDAAQVVDTFLAALDFPVERIQDARGRAAKLRGLLSGRKVLALIENVARTADVLPLLECLSGCLVMITSRRSLTGLTGRGAVNLSVPTLDYTEAKNWLARRVGPRAAHEPDAIAALTAICAGIPLALCSVADHVAIRPRVRLTEFVEELGDTRVLLGLGHTGDESIKTVHSWSYHELTAEEQQLFRVLGLHPGPDIGLDAAAALSGWDRDATKRNLDALVVANLLTQPESLSRYRFHDLIRKYATEFVAAKEFETERSAAETRLLSFYLHTASNADTAVFPYRPRDEIPPPVPDVAMLDFPDDETAMAWCDRERANLNAIIRHAVTRGQYAYVTMLASSSGEILQRLGYHRDAIDSLTLAIQSAREIGDVEAEGDALSNLGFIYVNLRELTSAERCLRSADDRYQTIGYEVGSAWVMHHLARLHVERGQYTRAIRLNLDALATLRQHDAASLEVLTLYRLAEAYRRAGNLDEATSYCRDGLWRAEQIGDQRGQALCLGELGCIHYERGDTAGAKGYCARALPVHERQRDLVQIGKIYNLLAILHRDEGELPDAERCAGQAVAFGRAARSPRDEAAGYYTLGEILRGQAQLDEAKEAWSRSLAIREDLDDPLAGSVRAQLAEIADVSPRVPGTRTEPLVPRRSPVTDPLIP